MSRVTSAELWAVVVYWPRYATPSTSGRGRRDDRELLAETASRARSRGFFECRAVGFGGSGGPAGAPAIR
ncbi:hypothetical protein AB5J62_43380 [Amycolatopsis sp. cg5]|uniref:hypothetical protein n=1 Tax=Amycolatopsis sp. cg5 TaxID=3238802 RepID=UPI003523EC8A